MRKFIVIGLAVFWILSFGTIAHAQKLDFKVSGFIDTATFWGVNTPYAYDLPPWNSFNAWMPPIYGPSPLFNVGAPGFGQALNKTRSFWQSRGRLKLDMIMEKNLSGTIFLEMDSGMWGEGQSADGRNVAGRWSADRNAVEVKNMYIDVGLPYVGIPLPMTARVGIQPLSVRPHMVVYNDGAGISGGIKIDPVLIQPMYFKPYEGLDYAADDIDVYGLNVSANIGTVTVGGFGLYYNQNTYPLRAIVASTVDFSSNMWWFGVYTDGKVGPVNINFDLVADTGEVKDRRAALPRASDVDYQGWATRLKVDYPWEKFNFGVVGQYASGSDQKRTDGGTSVVGTGGLPGNTTPWGTPTTKVSGYLVPTASEQFGSGESLLLTGYPIWNGFLGYNSLNYSQMNRGSIGGTWLAKLYGSYKPLPWYKVTLAGLYIGDTTKHGNTMGNARGFGGASPFPRNDGTIGVEFDLINEFNIYKNLKFDVGLGYLIAGDAMDYFNVTTGRNKSGDDPWVLITKLTYSF